jgi:predicted CopG family antitoxin
MGYARASGFHVRDKWDKWPNHPVKRVYVSDEVWERLMKIKVEKRLRSVDEALRLLLGVRERENTREAVEGAPEEEGEGGPGTSESPQPQASSSAAGKRPPRSATERSTPSAGAKAGAQPRKHKWTFCPQCLSMYDRLGKCPACGADLVPFGTEEGRRLYLKLKRERRAGWRER